MRLSARLLKLIGRAAADRNDEADATNRDLSSVSHVLQDQFGRDSLVEGMVLDRLACHLRSAGDPVQARALFDRAARIGFQHREQHAEIAMSWLSHLSVALEELGDYGEALPILRQLVYLYSWHLGESHPTTIEHRGRLVRVVWLSSIRGDA